MGPSTPKGILLASRLRRRICRTILATSLPGILLACKTMGGSGVPTYLVEIERGDTLASVAAKYDTSWDRIAKLNGISANTAPKVGTVLRVQPGPGGYVAQAPATVASHRSAGVFTQPVAAGTPAAGVSGSAAANANLTDNNIQEENFPDIASAAEEKRGRGGLLYGSGSNGNQLEWPLYGEVSSPYGMRHGRFHHGIDIRARKGTTVLAAGPGVVEFAGKQNGYGRVIIIRHKTLKTVYAHLSSVNVNIGQKVGHGTTIGETGLSGNSTGPHLHFEIRNLKDQSLDPLGVMDKGKLMAASRSGKPTAE